MHACYEHMRLAHRSTHSHMYWCSYHAWHATSHGECERPRAIHAGQGVDLAEHMAAVCATQRSQLRSRRRRCECHHKRCCLHRHRCRLHRRRRYDCHDYRCCRRCRHSLRRRGCRHTLSLRLPAACAAMAVEFVVVVVVVVTACVVVAIVVAETAIIVAAVVSFFGTVVFCCRSLHPHGCRHCHRRHRR